MEHPEPQTAPPSLLAPPSLDASQLDNLQTSSWTSQLSRPDHRALIPGPEAQQGPQLPPLVSLFDNATFDPEESQTKPTPDTGPTGWTGPATELLQANGTANASVGGPQNQEPSGPL